MKKWPQVFAAWLSILVSLPMTIYLQYQILKRVNATDLMWVFFWTQASVAAGVQAIFKAAREWDTK